MDTNSMQLELTACNHSAES